MSAEDDKTPTPTTLRELRDEINRLDEELLALLGRRREIAAKVIQVKEETGGPVRDERREQELLNRWVASGQGYGLDSHYVTRIFHEVVSDSLRSQQSYLQHHLNRNTPQSVAYHGVEGSYCVLAARQIYASVSGIEFKGYPTFEQVLKAVEAGEADEAVIPVENDDYGRLPEVFHLLAESSLSITGEARYRVDHALLGGPESSLSGLRTLLCSPFAYADCTSFITTFPDLQVEHLPDSAIAAEQVKLRNDPQVAAIASQEAASIYGLRVLQREVSDRPGLLVRYVVVGREPYKVDPRVPSKTSLILRTPQSAGSLVDALLIFREHSINLTRLESRTGRPGQEYQLFYLDLEGNVFSEPVKQALEKLQRVSASYKVLGCYPTLDLPRVAVSLGSQ